MSNSLARLCVVTVAALTLSGCAIRLYGTVSDSMTGQPVHPCTMGSQRYSSQTSPSGGYNIKLPRRTKTIDYRAPGYLPRTVRLERRFKNRHIPVNVAMDPDPAAVPSAPARFDPYRGKPLVPRFDPYTGEPLK